MFFFRSNIADQLVQPWGRNRELELKHGRICSLTKKKGDRKHDLGEIRGSFLEGKTILFQRNLGWWNIIIWPDWWWREIGRLGLFVFLLIYSSCGISSNEGFGDTMTVNVYYICIQHDYTYVHICYIWNVMFYTVYDAQLIWDTAFWFIYWCKFKGPMFAANSTCTWYTFNPTKFVGGSRNATAVQCMGRYLPKQRSISAIEIAQNCLTLKGTMPWKGLVEFVLFLGVHFGEDMCFHLFFSWQAYRLRQVQVDVGFLAKTTCYKSQAWLPPLVSWQQKDMGSVEFLIQALKYIVLEVYLFLSDVQKQ